MGSKQYLYLKAVDFRYTSIHQTAYVVIFSSHGCSYAYTHKRQNFCVKYIVGGEDFAVVI
jgi:hypothetical protein